MDTSGNSRASADPDAPAIVVITRKDRAQAPAFALGMFLIALSAFFLRNDAPLLLNGTRTQGEVMGYQQAPSKSGRYILHAWVRFKDGANQQHEFLDAISASGRLSPVGGAIGVIYEPTQPPRAIVDRGLWKESILAVPGVLGVMLLGKVFTLRRRTRNMVLKSTKDPL